MTSNGGARLKEDWMRLPAESFEPLTFGELKVGEWFIALPCPGDGAGRGGFREAHRIYRKTRYQVPGATVPTGRAETVHRGIGSDIPNSMPVVKLV